MVSSKWTLGMAYIRYLTWKKVINFFVYFFSLVQMVQEAPYEGTSHGTFYRADYRLQSAVPGMSFRIEKFYATYRDVRKTVV